MAVTIEEMPYEELPEYIAIVQRTFKSGLGAVLLDGPSPTQQQVAKQLKVVQEAYHNPINRFFKAVDQSQGQVLGVARWQLFPQQQTPEQLDETLKKAKPGDETYIAHHAPAIDFLHDSRREYMGLQPYVYLHVLTVDPPFQGRGAGRALIEWGTTKADELGIPTYVEASIEGYPVYERCGFRVVREVRFDMDKLDRADLPGDDVNRVMIRPARKDGAIDESVDWKEGHDFVWEPKYA